MRLFTKIFLCCMFVFSVAFQLAGYLLMTYSYENSIGQEKKYARNQFQYNKYIVQSALYMEPELFESEGKQLNQVVKSMNTQVAFYREDKKNIYSNLSIHTDSNIFNNAADGTITYQVTRQGEESCILSCGQIVQSGETIYMVTKTDISMVVENQRALAGYFQKLYLLILGFCFIFIFILTHFLTRPINRVSKAAKIITAGKYGERIPFSGKDEIGELAENFNHMAEKVEEKISELSDTARQKEDFVANFAHELKTPLTSVIGYADMLYQKDLPRNQVKDAAGYIMNEGMRLEALAVKLMDLIVLEKQDFILEIMSVQEIFKNIVPGILPVLKKGGAALHMNMEDGIIKAEFDLFKTMILNIIDNALKADSRNIWLSGAQKGNGYRLCIKDDGKGIPPKELDRIKEAFYMVDKSRSRKHHGAGLGLALADKIIKLHKAALWIESDGETGTAVYIELPAGR